MVYPLPTGGIERGFLMAAFAATSATAILGRSPNSISLLEAATATAGTAKAGNAAALVTTERRDSAGMAFPFLSWWLRDEEKRGPTVGYGKSLSKEVAASAQKQDGPRRRLESVRAASSSTSPRTKEAYKTAIASLRVLGSDLERSRQHR